MRNAQWLFGLALAFSATLSACFGRSSLGQRGRDAGGQGGDAGQNTQPATGCTPAHVSVDMSCNDDPNLPLPAGGCDDNGTCRCRPGYVLNPVSQRCKLDMTVDGGAVFCTIGADQTCNDDPGASGIAGTCVGALACACKTGYLLSHQTGRCKAAPVTDAGTKPAGMVCTFLLDQTCNDDDGFSGLAGGCMKGGTCGCNIGFVINPATGRCRAGSRPDAAPATPDSPGSQTCHWQNPDASFKHFRFLLTTPDGQVQTPPRSLDAGVWPINDFTGKLVEKTGNQITIDSCVPLLGCQPALYRFALCASGSGCAAKSELGDIDLPIPVGRLVRVVWHLDSARPMTGIGIYWLAIYDAEEGAGHGSLLFLGSGGLRPEDAGRRSYFRDLPFSVTTERLQCGGTYRDGGYQADDYRFLFSPKTGTGTALRLATGESGTFEFAEDRAPTQRFEVHCLDAVQTVRADDYWNWDFWMTGEIVPVPVDAGSKADAARDAGLDLVPDTAGPVTGTCSGSYTACGCACCTGDRTPAAVCYYPSAGETVSAIEAADQEAAKNPTCTSAACSTGQLYLCCVEAPVEPAGSAQYSATFTMSAYDRIALKKTGNDGTCMALGLVSPGTTTSKKPLRVSTPNHWGIEALAAGGCSTGLTEQAIGAQGTVTLGSNGTGCTVSVHVTAFFYSAASGTVTSKRIDAENVPTSGGTCH